MRRACSPPDVPAVSTATGLRYSSPDPTSQSNVVLHCAGNGTGVLGSGHHQNVGRVHPPSPVVYDLDGLPGTVWIECRNVGETIEVVHRCACSHRDL